MSDQTSSAGTSGTPIVIPPSLRTTHGALVDLIMASESMNDDERRYWIDILPLMTDEQVQKLEGILTREKDQLATIDQQYAEATGESSAKKGVDEIGAERKEKNEKRAANESENLAADSQAADNLLDQMQNL